MKSGCGSTADGGEGGPGEAKTCSCGSIRNVFVQDPDLFVQVRHAQLAPVPPTWGAHETQGIQTPGDLSGAGSHDGEQVVNPAAAGGAQVPSGDSPRGALPTLSDSGCPPVKVLKSQSSVSANALVGVRRLPHGREPDHWTCGFLSAPLPHGREPDHWTCGFLSLDAEEVGVKLKS